MESDYGCAGQAATLSHPNVKQAVRRETALDQLPSFADTAERVGDNIERFLERCRGSGLDCTRSDLRDVPTGHFAQLSRLELLLSRAEALAEELGSVG